MRGYWWYALGLLTRVYVFNYLDRTFIYILLPLNEKNSATDGRGFLHSSVATRSTSVAYLLRRAPYSYLRNSVFSLEG
ncbi:MAG TPA: hypothetical protein VEV42_06760 [Pyrinomonadaceae bacterium]|nr:hypothetical protein [Pyrinomonadaceae bacterium]